ncbi:MAG: glycosyltransferase family 39 protein [Anaerolineales bacterium]|nr:glycosyltransferase family 39 protein [Anaerolineales bacterium]
MNKRLLLILLAALALRLIGIQSRAIWYDEAFSILLSEKGPAAILHGTLAADADSSAAEEHPPAYYFALWAWTKTFGTSLPSVRLLSILFSLGVVVCVYFIAARLFNSRTAAVAAALAAALPFQVHYGVEVRMYAALAFWLALATLAYIKRRWVLFAVAAALAQYTHNLAAIYLMPLALTPLFQRDWKTLRNLTLAGLAALILYAPWLIQLPAQIAKATGNFWVEKPGAEKIFTLLLIYLSNLPLPNTALIFGLLFSALTVALAAFQTYRACKQKDVSASNGAWTAYLAFAPPLLLWAISQFTPIYIERALLPAHVMFCVWLAWALTQTQLPRPVQIFSFALILLSVGMGIFQHITYAGFPYLPPALTQSLQTRAQEGDLIVHSSKLSYLPALYYAPDLPQGFILDSPNSGVDTLSPATQKILGATAYADVESAASSARRVWFIIYQQSLDEYAEAKRPQPQLDYLESNFNLEGAEAWGDLRLYLYLP